MAAAHVAGVHGVDNPQPAEISRGSIGVSFTRGEIPQDGSQESGLFLNGECCGLHTVLLSSGETVEL